MVEEVFPSDRVDEREQFSVAEHVDEGDADVSPEDGFVDQENVVPSAEGGDAGGVFPSVEFVVSR